MHLEQLIYSFQSLYLIILPKELKGVKFLVKKVGRKIFLMLRCTAIDSLSKAVKRKPKPRIAFLREKAGLTQLELSRLVGVTESTIQNWESGRTGVDHIQRIVKFCKALNCQVEDLIELESDSPESASIKPVSLEEIHNLLGTDEEKAREAEEKSKTEESSISERSPEKTK